MLVLYTFNQHKVFNRLVHAKHYYLAAVHMSEPIRFVQFYKGKASIDEISVLNNENLIALMIGICRYVTYSLMDKRNTAV